MSKNHITGIDIHLRLNRQPIMTLHSTNGIQQTRPFDLGEFSNVINNHARQSIITPPEMLATNIIDWAIFWRPPMTQQILIGIYGSKETTALIVPLPGLVCKCYTEGRMKVAAFGGSTRPKMGNPLFKAPLPNVSGNDGTVCMGNTARPFQGQAADSINPDQVWAAYFSSAFTSHGANDRCRTFSEDIRLLLYSLEGNSSFPEEELIPMGANLEGWL